MRERIDKAYYTRQTYNRLGKNACTSHKIEARDLYNLVLADIIEHGKNRRASNSLSPVEGWP